VVLIASLLLCLLWCKSCGRDGDGLSDFYPREESNHGRQTLAMKGMKLLGLPFVPATSLRAVMMTEKERGLSCCEYLWFDWSWMKLFFYSVHTALSITLQINSSHIASNQ